MQTIRIRRGDTTPLEYTILDLDFIENQPTARDLTNCLVNFYLIADESTDYIVNGESCEITDATHGIIQFNFPTVNGFETATTGMYKAAFKVTDGTGTKKYPYETQWIHIYDDVGEGT